MGWFSKKQIEEQVLLPAPQPEGKRLSEQRRNAEQAAKALKADADQAIVNHFNKCWRETGL